MTVHVEAASNGTPVAGVHNSSFPWLAPRRRGWLIMSDGVIRFSTLGKLALGTVAALHLGLMGWALAQTAENGRALERLRAELAVRVQHDDADHAAYIRREELVEIVKRLDERLRLVGEAIRDSGMSQP